MSELTKMNLIAIVQQLPDEDIEFVQQYITILEYRLQQKENIIKEVREYIVTHKLYCFEYDNEEIFEIVTDKKAKDKLLEILDKGE